jgi:low temperature requirement protein LtrA
MTETIGPIIIIAAAFVEDGWRLALWLIALVATYSGVVVGRGHDRPISPAHFAERYGLIVIIALGESVISLGVAAAHGPITLGIGTTAVLGIVVIAALWWAYFDVLAVQAQRQLSQASGGVQTQLARDYYRYLHLPMIAGIVLFALGLHGTIEHVDEPLDAVSAVALCGGLSLYFLTHVLQRIRLVFSIRRTTTDRPGWVGPGRLVAGVAMLLLIPVALETAALVSLALAAAVCCALIAWDLVHYRTERVDVRRARP